MFGPSFHTLSAAFVSPSLSNIANLNKFFGATGAVFPTAMTPSSSTALMVVDPSTFPSAALNFFGGVRIPASLIAGSSVAAIFSLISQATEAAQQQNNISSKNNSRLELIVLRLYHAVALLSFCLSMTAIITSTTASTSLMLGMRKFDPTSYKDVYHFLGGELKWEFTLTRWSFLMSIFLFLTGVWSRLLLELQLLKPGRRRGAAAVGFTMVGFLMLLISNVNTTLNCWPNMFSMTVEMIQMVWNRAIETKGPFLLMSILSFTGATIFPVDAFVSMIMQSFPGIHHSNVNGKTQSK